MIKIYALIVALSAPFTAQAVESTLSTYSMKIINIDKGNRVSGNPSGNHTDIWVGFDNAPMNKDSGELINHLFSKLLNLKKSGSKLVEVRVEDAYGNERIKKAELALRCLSSEPPNTVVVRVYRSDFIPLAPATCYFSKSIEELDLMHVAMGANSLKSICLLPNLEKFTSIFCSYKKSFTDDLILHHFLNKKSCPQSNTLEEWKKCFVDIAKKDSIRTMVMDQSVLEMIREMCDKGIMEEGDIAERLLEGGRALYVRNTRIMEPEQFVRLIKGVKSTPSMRRFDVIIDRTEEKDEKDVYFSRPHGGFGQDEKLFFKFNNEPMDDHAEMEVRPECKISIPELTINRMLEKNESEKAKKVLWSMLSRATAKTVNVNWSVLSPDLIEVILPMAPSIKELNLTEVKISTIGDLLKLLDSASELQRCGFTGVHLNEDQDKMTQFFEKLAKKKKLQLVYMDGAVYNKLPKDAQDALLGNGRCIALEVWENGLRKCVSLEKDAQGDVKRRTELEDN